MKKLAIVSTHPIQYNAPLFKLLSDRKKILIKVFYTWSQSLQEVSDKGFGIEVKWDVPLLENYEYQNIRNDSTSPGTNSRKGFSNPELIPEIEKFSPDAVLVFGWFLKSHFQVMRHFKGKIPVIFRGDSTLLDEKRGIKTILRWIFLRWVYSYLDYALFVGANNKAYFLRHGVKESKLIFAPHAIDNNRFADSKYEVEASLWREKLGFSNEDIVVLFAGKFMAKKNPLMLIDAVQRVNSDTANSIKLLLVGNGELESIIQKRIKDDSNCKIIGFQNQSQMPVVYRLGDVFCMPSQGPYETWGLAVNEAMASGRPILSSNKAGCSIDLVQEGCNGWIFNHYKSDDLEEKLRLIITSGKDVLRVMGENSRKIIKDWSFENICKAIESIGPLKTDKSNF